MDSFQTIVILIFLAAILVGFAQKIQMPYPIALVLGGLALAFLPSSVISLKVSSFDPNLILLVVLPPILYYASFSISFSEFRKNWREIFSLALGLVVVTTLIVGVIFKWLFPTCPWSLAFAFGAIVSPPDCVATTAILKRFAISPRLLAVLEGESLINDASALVLYKLAVTALLSGLFSLQDAGFEFFKIVSGGVLIGFIFGLIIQRFSRRFLEAIPGTLFSITIPYITYILASLCGVSGVLAVVVNGLIGAKIVAAHRSSLRRVLAFAMWDMFIILINCFVFILIGLQLKGFLAMMSYKELALYTAYGFLITFAMIIIRLIWVYARFGIAYIYARQNPKTCPLCPQILREASLIGWSAMRGIVSLTAALALPYAFPDGKPIGDRDIVIFITFVVILLTLILPSSTLAYLIRMMKMDHHIDHHIAHKARKRLHEVADSKIRHLHEIGKITDKEFNILAGYFTLQRYIFEISSSHLKRMSDLEHARLTVFDAQRKELLALWESQGIDDKLFRQLEHELDVEESHIARAEI